MARAQVIARLRHPNLVRMLPLPGGVGLGPVIDDAKRLADFTERGAFQRFEIEQSIRLLLDVLNGLTALHEVDIDGQAFVHGQVSPQNIYVGEHGTARLVPLVSTHLMPDARPESSGYVAPEVLLGDPAGVPADLFSVGVMLWEILAGRRLFEDVSLDVVIAALVGGKRPPLTPPARAPWARALCAIAERAISTDPAERFSSASDLANAIAQAGGKHLSESQEGNWQDEAPTPVLHAQKHLQALRTVTPSATVVDIPAPPAARASELPPASVAPEPEPEPLHGAGATPESSSPVAVSKAPPRAQRTRAWLVGVASVPIAATLLLLRPPHARPPASASDAPSQAAAAPWAEPAASPAVAAASESVAAASESVAAASASAAPSAAPAASTPSDARAAPSPSATPVAPLAAPARAPQKRSALKRADYGI